MKHGSHIIAGQSDEELAAEQAKRESCEITHYPMFGKPSPIPFKAAAGSHGGGDRIMLEELFSENPPTDAYSRAATHVDGAAAILIGMSANESMATGRSIVCDDLLPFPS